MMMMMRIWDEVMAALENPWMTFESYSMRHVLVECFDSPVLAFVVHLYGCRQIPDAAARANWKARCNSTCNWQCTYIIWPSVTCALHSMRVLPMLVQGRQGNQPHPPV